MNKKLAAALSGVATLTMALSACGSSSSKIDDYAKSVCDQVQPQLQKIQNANNSITSVSGGSSKPDDVKSTDSAAFQQISDAYKALSNAVNNAGAPPVKDGAALQQNAVKELNDTSTAYAGLKKTVDGLNTGDQVAFANGLKGVAGQLTTLSKGGDDALSKLQSGDVGKAMAKQPGCRKASGSPSAGSGNPAPPPATQAPSEPASATPSTPSAAASASPSTKS
ncbi:small secreted protein [Streptomyces sp. RB6PN25]|uniref:Small secreted protein n=1 Tax=Streptomyces humicola TaxID=2953240 RepID=A0ABT1PU08_9ACTN|nr:small secreted protein [Streptomyces humicola]MCQ4081147.1 small secreted protein [Streptomyces humicola]